MFTAMMDSIKEESVGFLFNLEVQVEEEEPVDEIEGAAAAEEEHAPRITAKGLEAPKPAQNLSYTGPAEDGEAEVTGQVTASNGDDPFDGTGRNADCPFGWGTKYKKCHGTAIGQTGHTTSVHGCVAS